jgi:GT2 family glycosyltransferase/glycosyltransferase involved in cell wall biosynthesis
MSVANASVDVVVPIYRDVALTRKCIESVLAASVDTAYALILVDDASPDPEMAEYLASLDRIECVVRIRNPVNLGFVASVNIGMSIHPERDVVLLNSDTEVANDWLDRLRNCAYSAADIATVTPFSNNATICSYPVFCANNTLPVGESLADLDRVFSVANRGQYLEIPTAVGFCMYIRRVCLDALGLFDVSNFAQGYGEENDFSRRVAKAGWRNVLCADTFVFHVGGVSFGDAGQALKAAGATALRRLHPEYDELVGRFIDQDTPAPYRRAVDTALARRHLGLVSPSANTTRPVQLHIVHDHGGGTEVWYRDFCRADVTRTNLILKPYYCDFPMAQGMLLYAHVDDARPVAYWPFDEPIWTTQVTHAAYRQVLRQIIDHYAVDAVLVSSLLGHALDALDTGLPTILITHDYYPYCPAINSTYQGICSQCGPERLADCAENNTELGLPAWSFPTALRLEVRARYLDMIEQGLIVLVAPSASARARLQQLEPRLRQARWVTLPHGLAVTAIPLPMRDAPQSEKLRVVVLGRLSVAKGGRLLREGLIELLKFAELYLLGVQESGELFQDWPGVHVVETYDRDELATRLSEIEPDIGLLLSIVPETFSYTLGELCAFGIPTAATRLGAFVDRIVPGVSGYLFDPNPEALVGCLRHIAQNRQELWAIRANLMARPGRNIDAMLADYHALLPLSASGRGQTEPGPAEVGNRLLMDQALALAKQWKQLNRLQQTLELRAIRVHELRSALTAGAQESAQTSAELDQLNASTNALRDQVTMLRHQLDAVYASSSWRWSSPIRHVGNALRKCRIGLRCLAPALIRPVCLPAVATSLVGAWRQGGVAAFKLALLAVPEQVDREAAPSPVGLALAMFPAISDRVRAALAERIAVMPQHPLISILLWVDSPPPPGHLARTIDSLCRQLYPNWELCVIESGLFSRYDRDWFRKKVKTDSRIRLFPGVGEVSLLERLNHALFAAGGSHAIAVRAGDILAEQALFRIAESVIADHADIVYSDEILCVEDGTEVVSYLFKPMFSSEYLRAHHYIGQLAAFRTALLRQIGGFNATLKQACGYDLALRASHVADCIVHVPEMLFCSESAPGRLDRALDIEAINALQSHLHQIGEAGTVTEGACPGFFETRYPLKPGLKVAIVIPTRNHADLVRTCIESIQRTVLSVNYDIVLVDHESDDPAALTYFAGLDGAMRVLRYQGPFNFSAINNWAVAHLDGDYSHYLFCNNDVEALEPGWLERMLELGQKADVGIVGAKLYYPDRSTIQHAGIVVACCGIAENLARFRQTATPSLDTGYMGSLVANHEVSAVTGACLLIRKEAFDSVSGFDPSLAVGYGDVDLCLRVRACGYRVLFCAQATLVHHESYTRGHQEDPHPEDSQRFLDIWRDIYVTGDPYFSPNLSKPQTPNPKPLQK